MSPQLKTPRNHRSHIQPNPTRQDEIPKRYGSGRRCSTCGFTLSQFNPGDECWAHDQIGEPMTLADLMSQAA